jgi:hypothetical protein
MSSKQISAELKATRRSALLKMFQGAFSERPTEPVEVEPSILRGGTRRDLLLFGAGALATLAVGGSQLPWQVLQQLGLVQGGTTGSENKWLLNKALRLDDDVSTLLYSKHHLVPTYTKSQVTPLKNNYNGATPDPAYIPGWRLTLDGLPPAWPFLSASKLFWPATGSMTRLPVSSVWRGGAQSHRGSV